MNSSTSGTSQQSTSERMCSTWSLDLDDQRSSSTSIVQLILNLAPRLLPVAAGPAGTLSGLFSSNLNGLHIARLRLAVLDLQTLSLSTLPALAREALKELLLVEGRPKSALENVARERFHSLAIALGRPASRSLGLKSDAREGHLLPELH